MKTSEIIDGLEDLIQDRKSFATPDNDKFYGKDNPFRYDIEVLQAAINELNRRAEPEDKALTLEQLRKMCKPTITQLQQTEPYAPVWIVTLPDKKISCQITRGLIKTDNRCKPQKEYIDAHMVGLLLPDYGKTWLAYARKPKGSETP